MNDKRPVSDSTARLATTISPLLWRSMIENPATRRAGIVAFADYFRDLCLLQGCEVQTAANVWYAIVTGLEADWGEG